MGQRFTRRLFQIAETVKKAFAMTVMSLFGGLKRSQCKVKNEPRERKRKKTKRDDITSQGNIEKYNKVYLSAWDSAHAALQ